ncbi:tRNA pseudouridine(55) synthase TruB [candidate division WWE3 bacterium]|uniref:tRNA pseudouridine synthase B n=1 Tax=candidate division WWE3 bacterium TaxID=2053526 RepID=A0A955LVN1_UNCKA|nr:tRNA pseudouridine(55) synthase TruB [candidate division WWE3 bacterium]
MKNSQLNGMLIVDKPKGWTSHDVVAKLRNTLSLKKIGHGGTLDPEATGLLIILLGTFTKKSEQILGLDKSYTIDFILGRSTTTGDEEGETIEALEKTDETLQQITQKDLGAALESLRGKIAQQVPWFSAIKVDGKKLYQYARGKSPEELNNLDTQIERPVREIEIKRLEIERFEQGTDESYPKGALIVDCSSGTYTRVLVEDLGKALHVPAYQTDLRRMRIGDFTLDQALEEKDFESIESILSRVIIRDDF